MFAGCLGEPVMSSLTSSGDRDISTPFDSIFVVLFVTIFVTVGLESGVAMARL